jgi:hypothetical protein
MEVTQEIIHLGASSFHVVQLIPWTQFVVEMPLAALPNIYSLLLPNVFGAAKCPFKFPSPDSLDIIDAHVTYYWPIDRKQKSLG